MSVTRLLANEFNGDQVVSHFGVAPHQTVIIAAMNFMFRTFKEVYPTEATDLKGRSKEVAIQTQTEIDNRYDLFKELCDDIPKKRKFDIDALAVAVICDEYVLHINEPRQAPNGDIVDHYDGIEEDLAKRAQRLWEEACDLLDGSIPPRECSAEAIILGHILPFRNLNEHIEEFAKDPDADYSEILDLISAIRLFADKKTNIGMNLIAIVNDIEQELLARPQISTLPPPPFDDPHSFSEFDADTVFARLHIEPDQVDARMAAEFVYDHFYGEAGVKMEKFERTRFAVDASIQSIEPRLLLHKYHAADFFEGEDIIDPRALIYTTICGNHLYSADKEIEHSHEEPEIELPAEEPDPLHTLGAIFEKHIKTQDIDKVVPLFKKAEEGVPPKFYGDDLNDVSVRNGIAILEEADCLRAGYWPYPERNPYTESFFIAHVDSIVDLRTVENLIETYSAEELEALEDKLKCYDNLAKRHTKIGQELDHHIAMTATKIKERKEQLGYGEEPASPAPRGHHLRLVTPDLSPG